MNLKTLAPGLVITTALTLTGIVGVVTVGAKKHKDDAAFDAAKTYKGKCVACHGPKAEKKFDSTKSDEEHVQIILKGKKPEKPPNMPAYETKGMTADQAKALLDYMKSLKQ